MAVFLLIDDDQSMLTLTSKILSRSFPDAVLLAASTGGEGLELARREVPDVILLDMVLPDIDGLEICRELKQDAATSHIAVILMTGACKDAEHKAAGLETGADSYLYKPFEQAELVAQVHATLRTKQAEDLLRLQKQSLEEAFQQQTEELRQSREVLARKVEELERQVENQTQELIRTDRLAAMGILAAGIAHEVNNPNTFINSNLQTFRMFWETLDKYLVDPRQAPEELQSRVQLIRREMSGLLQGMEEGSRRIAAIVTGMKNYIAGNQAEDRVVNLLELVEAALALVWNQIKHDVVVQKDFEPGLAPVFGSEQLLCQVLVNLVMNAAHAVKGHRGEGVIRISGYSVDGYSVLSVQDDGPGIEPEKMRNLFNPFFTTRRGLGGTGLGLFVSHGIIKGHNGMIEVDSQPGHGATFQIKLPAIVKDLTLAADIEAGPEPERACSETPAERNR